MAYGLNVAQVKQFIIRPTLAQFPLKYDTEAATNLLAGTMLVETGGVFIAQDGGPAIGICQMEQATHDDCYATFLNYPENAAIRIAARAFIPSSTATASLHMHGNLYYAFAMCRVKYIRAPAPLPAAVNAYGLAMYHKMFYNTALGATEIDKSVALFQEAINA